MNSITDVSFRTSSLQPSEMSKVFNHAAESVSQSQFNFFNKYYGFVTSRAISWAVEACLSEKIINNPNKTLNELALELGYKPASFRRIMRFMISQGLYTIGQNDELKLTELSKALLHDDVREAILRDYAKNWSLFSTLKAHDLVGTIFEDENKFSDDASRNVWNKAMAYKVSKAIFLAVELKLAERLSYKPRSIDELAADISINREGLKNLMTLLAKEGFFVQITADVFGAGPMELFMSEHSQKTLASLVLLESEDRWKGLEEIDYSLRGDETAFKKVHGKDYFDFLQEPKNAQIQSIFDAAMSQISEGEIQGLVSNLKLDPGSVVMDVGGGQGKLLASVLQNNLEIRGILFDLPSVVEVKERLRVSSLGERCLVEGGSFFEKMPSADVYLLKRVIHDWNDVDASRILKRCVDAIRPGGRVILAEMVMPSMGECEGANEKTQFLCMVDAYMMALLGGGERTSLEFEKLFKQVGLELIKRTGTDSYLSIMETKVKI